MMYSEAGKSFDYIPQWVVNLITFGYRWKESTPDDKRRIGIISMPCESAAAAMVALGALRKDLEDGNANNLDGHFDYLKKLRDSLTVEEKDESILIDNDGFFWKFENDSSNEEIRIKPANYKEYIKRKGRIIPNPNGPPSKILFSHNSYKVRLKTDPIVEVNDQGKTLSKDDYKLVPACMGKMIEDNLSKSYQGLLFVGKASGKDSQYVRNLYDIHFKDNNSSVSLGKLLTLHHNNETPIARLKFCNNSELKNQSQGHYLVVADGVNAFCDSLQFFKQSDVIGVCARDSSVESAENLLNEIAKKQRYYTDQNNSAMSELSSKSVSIRILEKR